MFLLIAVTIPLLVYFLTPLTLSKLTGRRVQADTLLLIACLTYFISWFLPSPLIHGHNTSFTTHFVGGGIFTGLLWLYCWRALNPKPARRFNTWLEAATLFAAVSALGALNELFELAIVELNLVNIPLTDTSYDILANTLGAALFFVGYAAFRNRLNPRLSK